MREKSSSRDGFSLARSSRKAQLNSPNDENTIRLANSSNSREAAQQQPRDKKNYTNLVFHIEFEFLSSELLFWGFFSTRNKRILLHK